MKMAEGLFGLAVFVLLFAVTACSQGEAPISRATPTLTDTPPPTTTPIPKPQGDRGDGGFFRGPFSWHRDVLSFCIDGAGGLAISDEDIELVRGGRELVVSDLGDGGFMGWVADARIVEGCPPSTVPLGSRVVSRSAASNYHARVEVASDHRVFVYFVPEETYSVAFGDAPYFAAAAEICCMTGNDVEATTAVYVTRSVTAGRLGEALMGAIGFGWYCAPADICPTPLPS